MVRKDPNKPKGRMSSYAFFVKFSREEVKEQSVNFAQFSKSCSERWKNLADHEKKKFLDCADHDKQRYEREMARYVPPKGIKKKGRRKKKDPNAPKRNLSPFFLFSNDERPKIKAVNPKLGIGEIARILSGQWKVATPELKAKYDRSAMADKERYIQAMSDYKERCKQCIKKSSSSSSSSSSSGSSSSSSSDEE